MLTLHESLPALPHVSAQSKCVLLSNNSMSKRLHEMFVTALQLQLPHHTRQAEGASCAPAQAPHSPPPCSHK